LQWAAWFFRRREEGREKPSARAPSRVASANTPYHCAWDGETHQMPPRKSSFSSVLALHVPPEKDEGGVHSLARA